MQGRTIGMKKRCTAIAALCLILLLFAAAPLAAAGSTDIETGMGAETGTGAPFPDPSGGGNALTPHVIVSGYSFGGDYVTNGKKFTLNYTLKNTSASLAVENVIVQVGGGESLVISKDTDTFYVDRIAPKGTKSLSITLTPMQAAATTSYPIAIAVGYEYYDGGSKYAGASELAVTVPLRQEQKVRLENVGFSESELNVDEEYELNFKIINSGYGKLANMEVRVYDAEGGVLASSYLGGLAPGAELANAGNLYLILKKEGSQTLGFELSYEDDMGNGKTLDKTVEVTASVYEPPIIEEDIPLETGPRLPVFAWILLALAIVGASVASILAHRKKQARAAAAAADPDAPDQEDEEDDDEDF